MDGALKRAAKKLGIGLTDEEKERRELERKAAAISNANDKSAHIAEKRVEIRSAFTECRRVFDRVILDERMRKAQMELKGLSNPDGDERVRAAAMGIMILDMAAFELEAAKTEQDLNKSLNTMGRALRQVRRLDNRTEAVSARTRKILGKYNSDIEVALSSGDILEDVRYAVPREVARRIDKEFVNDLLNGDGYELSMLRARMRQKDQKDQVSEVVDSDDGFDEPSTFQTSHEGDTGFSDGF